MVIKQVTFIKSAPGLAGCPPETLPEYAFVGRSNVGKSSLINMLTDRKMLARISSTPGKTSLINYFLVDESWYMVDLPGYGYAKLSHTRREAISKMLDEYILGRMNLTCLFVLVDCRLEPQKADIDFIYRIGEQEVPFAIIFTKTDKISSRELTRNMGNFEKEMNKTWESLPKFFISSAKEKKGKDEILGFIEKTNKKISKKLHKII
ncbi:MAG: ribosome biogenesis GTP-binding protein YihA/YsxC [Bacteroidia bacterium]|nr:ribosome biogenesis GTP-binding protein YihA/YsxC [Bacteroidia bacterium]